MRAPDCTAVESPEFLLAALERATDAMVILDGITASVIATRRPS